MLRLMFVFARSYKIVKGRFFKLIVCNKYILFFVHVKKFAWTNPLAGKTILIILQLHKSRYFLYVGVSIFFSTRHKVPLHVSNLYLFSPIKFTIYIIASYLSVLFYKSHPCRLYQHLFCER